MAWSPAGVGEVGTQKVMLLLKSKQTVFCYWLCFSGGAEDGKGINLTGSGSEAQSFKEESGHRAET